MHGILFRPTGLVHPINSKDPSFDNLNVYHPNKQDVIIWCDNLASARVLQDVVNGLALKLNGYIVDDAQEQTTGTMEERKEKEMR